MDSVLRRQLEARVVAGMEQASREPMVWGKDDCALWAANIVRDVLPYDPVAPFRGRYATRRGALRVLGPKGLKGAMQAAARRHKWRRIDPRHAKPGDAGLIWTTVEAPAWAWQEIYNEKTSEYERKRVRVIKPVPTLATVICLAPGWFVGRNERGFTGVSAKHVARAWAVLDDLEHGQRVSMPRLSTRPVMVPTSAICHEPVSATIGLTSLLASGFAATGVGYVGAFAAASALGGALVSGALAVGVSLAASLLQPQSGTGALDTSLANSTQQGVQITERQSIPYKRVIVGSAYVGGAVFFEQVKPPYLTIGTLVNFGEIAGVDKVFIGTNQLSFASGITPDTILTPINVVGQPTYSTRLRVSFRFGATDQVVDPLILAKYSSVGSEFRQRGTATAVFEYHYGASQTEFLALWGQVARPNAYLVVRGVVAYDPRDPLQDLDDESTWTWTNNATLIQAWYLTRSYGGRIPTSRIDWDRIAISADYDDELIGTNTTGELIKRHTIDGVITLNQKPYEVMRKLLTANRGMVLESAGMVWVESSRPKTAIATIHDRILTGGIKYHSAKSKENLINKLQVRLVSPEQEYQLVDGPILSRTDLQTADGETLIGTLTLDFTQDHRRAQRLQKAFLESSRLGRTVTCSVDIRLMAVASDELIGNVVTVSSSLFSIANGTYLVTGVGFSDDCTSLSLALTECDSSIETDWNPEIDEQPFTLASINVS